MSVLVFVETVDGIPTGPSLVALTASRPLGVLQAVVIGDIDISLLGAYGVQFAHRIDLDEYAPQAWGTAVAQVAADIDAKIVTAASTARGNEVLAHAAVDVDQPFAANCLTYDQDSGTVLRVRWGGSLFEEATLEGSPAILSFSQFALEESPAGEPASTTMIEGNVSISDEAMLVTIVDQEQAAEGVTLATARLVVSGGRGVGSAEGFAILDELAGMLGGKVGCSRVVTNNGWRPHADQVGQTGTVVAPDLYIACGISGAIQHWVGMMASKTVLAINTDPDAPMMTKADYAVIGDVHEVVPAIIEEIRTRSAG